MALFLGGPWHGQHHPTNNAPRIVVPLIEDEELLETYRASVNKAMDEASARDGFATNMSRESIVAGLRAVFDMSKGEKRAEDEREALALNIMAQAFYEATSAPGSGIRYAAMAVKPEIVAGLRAALDAISTAENIEARS